MPATRWNELAPDGLFLGRIVVIVARLTADSMGLGPVENGTRLGSRHAIPLAIVLTLNSRLF
jgi:hypothetical protein